VAGFFLLQEFYAWESFVREDLIHIILKCRKESLIAACFSGGQGWTLELGEYLLGDNLGFRPQTSFIWAIQHDFGTYPYFCFTYS
jgi:hypothetical protein